MKISVIVTTYNDPSTLRRVLDGLALQNERPTEVIVADDGSGPDTEALVRELSGTLPFPLLHVWQEDLGFRAAKIRNEAVKASSGDYLVFLDGDCIANRYFIADHRSLSARGCFVQGKRVLVGKGASDTFDASSANSFAALFKMALTGEITNSRHILRLPFLPAYTNRRIKGIKSCNLGMFREDVLAVNGFNEDFVGWGREDSEFAARLFNYGLKRRNHRFIAVCFHLWHPENKRDNIDINDEILEATLSGDGYWCKSGIAKGL